MLYALFDGATPLELCMDARLDDGHPVTEKFDDASSVYTCIHSYRRAARIIRAVIP